MEKDKIFVYVFVFTFLATFCFFSRLTITVYNIHWHCIVSKKFTHCIIVILLFLFCVHLLITLMLISTSRVLFWPKIGRWCLQILDLRFIGDFSKHTQKYYQLNRPSSFRWLDSNKRVRQISIYLRACFILEIQFVFTYSQYLVQRMAKDICSSDHMPWSIKKLVYNVHMKMGRFSIHYTLYISLRYSLLHCGIEVFERQAQMLQRFKWICP